MGLAATFGPILGGWLVNADLFGLSWRAVFLVNVPIGVIALAAAVKVLPSDIKHERGTAPKLDILGMLLATAAIMFLVYPLVQGREAGWPTWTFVMMAASVPMFGVFGIHQRLRFKADRDPFVVPTLFRKRSFNSGIAVMMAFGAAMSGIFFTSTLFLQIGLHYTALHAGLTMLPWSLGTIVSMGAGQSLMPKVGPRRMLQSGMLIMGAGSALAAILIGAYGLTTTTWTLVPPLFVCGLGMGLIFGPIFGTVLGDLDDEEVGSASGLLNAVQQLSGAFGIAALGTLFFNEAGATMTHVPDAAKIVFLVSAGILVAAWGIAFSMSKHAAETDH
jgi:MFS family permease